MLKLILLLIFFVTTFGLTLFLRQKIELLELSEKNKTNSKSDRLFLNLLFGFLAAAMIASIWMLLDHFLTIEKPIYKNGIPIVTGFILFTIGSKILTLRKNANK